MPLSFCVDARLACGPAVSPLDFRWCDQSDQPRGWKCLRRHAVFGARSALRLRQIQGSILRTRPLELGPDDRVAVLWVYLKMVRKALWPVSWPSHTARRRSPTAFWD